MLPLLYFVLTLFILDGRPLTDDWRQLIPLLFSTDAAVPQNALRYPFPIDRFVIDRLSCNCFLHRDTTKADVWGYYATTQGTLFKIKAKLKRKYSHDSGDQSPVCHYIGDP